MFARVAARCARIAFADIKVAVSRARTGVAAVRNVERRLPQLVLLDYNLPELDGVEVLSRIRALPGGDSVSVIVMSGAIEERERWRFSVLGVRDFVHKPVEFSEFVMRIVQKGRQRGWLPREADRVTESSPGD